jgi:hypothetical protein
MNEEPKTNEEQGMIEGSKAVVEAASAIAGSPMSPEATQFVQATERLPAEQMQDKLEKKSMSWKKKAAIGTGVVLGLAGLGLVVKYRHEIGDTLDTAGRLIGKGVEELKSDIEMSGVKLRERSEVVAGPVRNAVDTLKQKGNSAKQKILSLIVPI